LVAIINVLHLLEDALLPIDIGGNGISLCNAETDLAGGQRLEDARRELREAHTLLDEAGGHRLLDRDLLDAHAHLLDEEIEALAFIGRVHHHTLSVLGKARTNAIRFVREHKHGHLMAGRQRALLDQTLKCAESAAAGLHSIVARLL
jgi:hypothetical protein